MTSTPPELLALLCGIAALIVALPGRRIGRRRRSRTARPWRGPRATRWTAAVLAGLVTAVLVGGWVGATCAVPATAAAGWALGRLQPASIQAERAACAADLPLAADLLAAALTAGAPVDRAATAVAAALGGPLGDRLARAGRSLRLGAEPAEAWEHLADIPACGRLIAAAVRSSSSGAALAGALLRLAEDLRADRAAEAEAIARRAGVLIVLPLGLCFLPAFVLAGLAPVIAAVFRGLL